MVIVGGGDGSLSSFVDFFVGTKVVFAFLPLGTANSFARTVGVPLDLDGAVDVIANGVARKIDVGCINGDYFLNAAAMGIAPKVAETVPHGLKRKLGRLGYLVWASWSAANFRAFRVKLEDGKRTVRMWATEVRIANGRYHGGIELIENADLKSGEIVIQVVTGRSVLKLGWSYFAAATKLEGAAPDGAGVRRAEVHAQHQAAHARVDRRRSREGNAAGDQRGSGRGDDRGAARKASRAAPTPRGSVRRPRPSRHGRRGPSRPLRAWRAR